MQFRTAWKGILFLVCGGSAPMVCAQSPEEVIVETATNVLQETMMLPAGRIPHDLLRGARGVAIFPNVLKGGFVVGVRHGRGVILVRDNAGKWQPPVFLSITGGSVGWQAGLQATDLLLIFRTRSSVDSLLKNKLTLGVDAAVAAGPAGRLAAASTDLMLRAEVLSYSRSRGFFVGLSLDGSSLQVDPSSGLTYYQGTGTTPLGGSASATATLPPSAARLVAQLDLYTDGDPSNDVPLPPGCVLPGGIIEPQTPDHLRKQLVESSGRLEQLLDDQWKAYLALPKEDPKSEPPTASDYITVLRRYDTAAADPRYAALAERLEFAVAYRLLRDYVAMAVAKEQKLLLPPPPADVATLTDATPANQ